MNDSAGTSSPLEESLDPASWDGLGSHGHALLDEMFDWLRTVRDRPAWRPIPEDIRQSLRSSFPLRGQGLTTAWDDFRRLVLLRRIPQRSQLVCWSFWHGGT